MINLNVYDRLTELTAILKHYDIKSENVVLVGSTVIADLLEREPGDIDIVLSDSKYVELKKSLPKGKIISASGTLNLSDNVQVLRDRYGGIGIRDDDLFKPNYHYVISGSPYRFARPELEFCKKVQYTRDKDINDINDILKNLDPSKWDWGMVKVHKRKKSYGTYAKLLLKNPKGFLKKSSKYFMRKVHSKSIALTSDKLAVRHLDIGLLLQMQTTQGKFGRLDIFVRMALAKHYLDIKDTTHYNASLENYRSMQIARGANVKVNTFKQLCLSVATKGYDGNKYPVNLNPDGTLFDGAHRVACALAKGEESIPVLFKKRKLKRPSYGEDWFLNHFPEAYIQELKDSANQYLDETGARFQMVIWSPALPFLNEIINHLNKSELVSNISSHDIFEINNFEEFCEYLYVSDDIANWKIRKKIDTLASYPHQISLISFDVAKPTYRTKTVDDYILNIECAVLKSEIRTQHKARITNYVDDIICHCGDNPRMNRDILKAVELYKS